MANVSVALEWQPVGDVVLADHLRFPRLDEVYVREADRLVRWVNGHHTAAAAQPGRERGAGSGCCRPEIPSA